MAPRKGHLCLPRPPKPWLKMVRILGYIHIWPWNHFPNFCVSAAPPPIARAILEIRCRVCGLKAQNSDFQAFPLRVPGMTQWGVRQPCSSSKGIEGMSGRRNQWPRSPAEITLRKAMGRFPIKHSPLFSSCLSWLWYEDIPQTLSQLPAVSQLSPTTLIQCLFTNYNFSTIGHSFK